MEPFARYVNIHSKNISEAYSFKDSMFIVYYNPVKNNAVGEFYCGNKLFTAMNYLKKDMKFKRRYSSVIDEIKDIKTNISSVKFLACYTESKPHLIVALPTPHSKGFYFDQFEFDIKENKVKESECHIYFNLETIEDDLRKMNQNNQLLCVAYDSFDEALNSPVLLNYGDILDRI